jgi:hypothetical protein
MKWGAKTWAATAMGLAMAAGARAQFGPPRRPAGPRAAGPVILRLAPPAGPMGGVFSFVGPLSDVRSAVVKGQPFSANVVRDTVEQLADGNRIERKSIGMIARDSDGRTRRVITLENIGPWASVGKAPQLVIIDDPVTGKVYTLDAAKRLAVEMAPPPRLNWVAGNHRAARSRDIAQGETKTESLGEKTMEGVLAEGSETIRRIPAGQIGNEKPIVITIERWYSPELQTTIFLKRTDPRFGITTYELQNIDLAEPPESLFEVPSDYTIQKGRVNRGEPRARDAGSGPRPSPDFP